MPLSRAPVPAVSERSKVEVLRVDSGEVEPPLTRIRHLQRENKGLEQLIVYLETKHLPEEP